MPIHNQIIIKIKQERLLKVCIYIPLKYTLIITIQNRNHQYQLQQILLTFFVNILKSITFSEIINFTFIIAHRPLKLIELLN